MSCRDKNVINKPDDGDAYNVSERKQQYLVADKLSLFPLSNVNGQHCIYHKQLVRIRWERRPNRRNAIGSCDPLERLSL